MPPQRQSIREILGSKKADPKATSRPNVFEDSDSDKSNDSTKTFVNAEDLKAEMKPFKELLEEYREMKLRFSGIVALPPGPAEMKGKPQSFKETLAYATTQPLYAKVWKKMKEVEEKNNATKVKLFAFLQAVADLGEGRESENFDEVDVGDFYNHAGEEANSVIATWTLHAKAEKLTLEEYVNRYVKF